MNSVSGNATYGSVRLRLNTSNAAVASCVLRCACASASQIFSRSTFLHSTEYGNRLRAWGDSLISVPGSDRTATRTSSPANSGNRSRIAVLTVAWSRLPLRFALCVFMVPGSYPGAARAAAAPPVHHAATLNGG